ncbi:hypothetical protein BX257_8934 [Streptomyces sp. 3212.3]|nr:hypothetical protein BX257_8934 [Streptomyces sp. 3212.3]
MWQARVASTPEDGAGAPYSLPSGSDEVTRKDTYFKVPFPAQAAVTARAPRSVARACYGWPYRTHFKYTTFPSVPPLSRHTRTTAALPGASAGTLK